MIIRNLPVKLLALLLVVVAVAVFLYKVKVLNLPLQPTEAVPVWTVEARIDFKGGRGPIRVDFAIPTDAPGFVLLDEDFVSSNYGLSVAQSDAGRRAQWTVRRGRGEQVLYYRATLWEHPEDAAQRKPKRPAYPAVPDYPPLERTAIEGVLEQARSKSADTLSFTWELLTLLNAKEPDESVQLLQKHRGNRLQWARYVQTVLAGARIPSRLVHVLKLKDGVRSAQLLPWLEVFNGDDWHVFNPRAHERGLPGDALIWYRGNVPLLQVEGGRGPTVRFSVMRDTVSQLAVAERTAARFGDSGLIEYSLLSLPLDIQNVYRILLMVPLGAFILVLLRTFVGIQTFGTFMPVLIALAFYETHLLWGLVLFSLVTALGLSVRFYLERLRLLLVPRLASVLIVVILLMLLVSILSYKLGFERGLSVALFPMVILTMVIERMSLVWEESGARDALIMGAGSLAAAVLSYLVMKQPLLQHLIFVFPELLLAVLAATLLMGRYTGYRLLELWRFRGLLKGSDNR